LNLFLDLVACRLPFYDISIFIHFFTAEGEQEHPKMSRRVTTIYYKILAQLQAKKKKKAKANFVF